MYHECNLVHGDLSEYNILWHEDRPVIIDVSQSVEHAHPYANDFLRKDISNITDFFGKKGLRVLSNFELFQFVTDHFLLGPGRQFQGNSAEQEPIDVLIKLAEELLEVSAERGEVQDDAERDGEIGDDAHVKSEEARMEEAVFLQSYIPVSLSDINNPVQVSHSLIVASCCILSSTPSPAVQTLKKDAQYVHSFISKPSSSVNIASPYTDYPITSIL
jgi:RIO1 family